MFRAIAGEPLPGDVADYDVEDRLNSVGHLAIGTPGSLMGWTRAAERYGRLPLARLLEPAIRQAAGGFPAGAYLVSFIREHARDMARFEATAEVCRPGGQPPAEGATIVRADYARTLEQIAAEGPGALYGGSLGRRVVEDVRANGGILTLEDLAGYRLHERAPVRGTYRGHEVVTVGLPSAGGPQLLQVLEMLEGYGIGRGPLAFGTAACVHLFAEAMRVSFADRFRYMADPAGLDVPVERLISGAYAAAARGRMRLDVAGRSPVLADALVDDRSTTHVTVVDEEGTIVSATQTVQSAFGSKVTAPGTGMLLNNLMLLMDPRPERPNSIAPGKRILSSMAPSLVLRAGRPYVALGLPGGRRIFGAVAQAVMNLVDHGMTLQQAVEAPRAWTQGGVIEIEDRFTGVAELRAGLEALGHDVAVVQRVGGGMNGVQVGPDGLLHGSACWRADSAPIGVSGGPAAPRRLP
jgi:gamma-glutamyltranspeptidase/glutathione hydrolase